MAFGWLTKNMKLFEEQFACIGVGEEPKKDAASGATESVAEGETKVRGALIEQHCYNLFKFYATGRLNCNYCLVTLEMKRRQDLFTMITFNLLWPELDRVSYEIPLSFTDSYPCIFAIIKRNELKTVLENHKILVKFHND